jgi:hypothetical protein
MTSHRRRRRRRPSRESDMTDTLDQEMIPQEAMKNTRGEIMAERHKVAALERQLSIQQQISLLRWRKQQASAKMRNILSDSRAMRRRDTSSNTLRKRASEEHSQWMYSVVESEMQRPLEVDDDFIQKYTNDARKDYERLERDTRHHIDIVSKLKKQLLEKEDQRRRYVEYKIKREAYGLTPGPLDDGDGRAETPGKVDGGASTLDPNLTNAAAPSKIVERLEDLDAIEHHLHGIRRQWADKEPSFLENPATDLFLLRVPQPLATAGGAEGGSIVTSNSMPNLGAVANTFADQLQFDASGLPVQTTQES